MGEIGLGVYYTDKSCFLVGTVYKNISKVLTNYV